MIAPGPAMALNLTLEILEGRYAICRLPSETAWPECLLKGHFCSLTRSGRELSAVVPEAEVDPAWETLKGWRGLRVKGPLDFEAIGVLASLAMPLTRAGISLFSVSTFLTDYLFVREGDLTAAAQALQAAGHAVSPAGVKRSGAP